MSGLQPIDHEVSAKRDICGVYCSGGLTGGCTGGCGGGWFLDAIVFSARDLSELPFELPK